jgi:hypothetical protein
MEHWLESLAIEDQDQSKARDSVRAKLAQASKAAELIGSDEDISDIPPHLLGR